MTRDDRWLGWLFAGFACLYLLTSGGHFYASDDVQKFLALDALVRTGGVSFPDGWAVGRGGLHYSWFPLGGSLLMLPGYLVGRLMVALVPWLPGPFVIRFFITLQNAFLTAAVATLLAAYARRLGQSRAAALFAAACFGLGTMAWPYAKTAWSEPGATLLLFGACFTLQAARNGGFAWKPTLLTGLLAALAISARQELAVTLLGVVMWLGFQERARPGGLPRVLGLLALPVAIAALAALGYNEWRYAQLSSFVNFQTIEDNLQFPPGGRPVWALVNAWHYTLNPDDGLAVYSPAVLAGLLGMRAFFRGQRETATLLAAVTAPLFFFYTYVWGLSDWAWALRYSYMFLPFLCLPAATLWDARPGLRKLAGALFGLGVCVQLVAMPQNFNYLYERYRAAHHDVSIQEIMRTPAASPLLMALEATPATLQGGLALLTTPRPPGPLPVEVYRARAQFVPDVWPCLLLLAPVPRWAIAGLAGGLLAGLAFALDRLRRSLYGASAS